MPIVSVSTIDSTKYRVTLALGNNKMENIVLTTEGLYSIHYIKEGKSINHTGRIMNIVKNASIPHNSYILFDWSSDNSNRKERIYFYQVQYIKDITPNDAYQIALKHGFVGSVEDWLESMRGYPGKDNYEIAVDCGYKGTREEWLKDLQGRAGFSAYEIAKNNGYEGTEEEWLKSLKGEKGDIGKSAYDIAVENGFKGTEEEWLKSLTGPDGKSAYDIAVENGYEGTIEDWLAQNGDISLIRQDVSAIQEAITWKSSV